jgi:hypothetical protein
MVYFEICFLLHTPPFLGGGNHSDDGGGLERRD